MSASFNPDVLWTHLATEIDVNARRRIEKVCEDTGQSIPVVIAQLGLAPDDVVVSAFEEAFELNRINLEKNMDKIIVEDALSPNFLKTRRIILFENDTDGDRLAGLAMVNPMDAEAISGVEFATGKRPIPYVVSLTDWRRAFETAFPEYGVVDQDDEGGERLSGWADDTTRLKDMASDAPIIRKLESILTEAVDMGLSLIHI